jgi:hypothetical protein
MKRFVAVIVAVAVGVTLLGASRAKTSEKYSNTVYRERSDRITVLVDAYIASFHEADDYIPFPVAIGLRSGKNVTISHESFTLVDQEGNVVPLATYQEINENYNKIPFDESLREARPLVIGQQFENSTELPSQFFPSSRGSTYLSRVEMAPFTWFNDVLYFPRPPAGLGGVLVLRVTGSSLEQPVEVRFEVPLGRRS